MSQRVRGVSDSGGRRWGGFVDNLNARFRMALQELGQPPELVVGDWPWWLDGEDDAQPVALVLDLVLLVLNSVLTADGQSDRGSLIVQSIRITFKGKGD